jgi:hypothetical protein
MTTTQDADITGLCRQIETRARYTRAKWDFLDQFSRYCAAAPDPDDEMRVLLHELRQTFASAAAHEDKASG